MSQPKKLVMGGESRSSGDQLTAIARIGLLVCFARPKVDASATSALPNGKKVSLVINDACPLEWPWKLSLLHRPSGSSLGTHQEHAEFGLGVTRATAIVAEPGKRACPCRRPLRLQSKREKKQSVLTLPLLMGHNPFPLNPSLSRERPIRSCESILLELQEAVQSRLSCRWHPHRWIRSPPPGKNPPASAYWFRGGRRWEERTLEGSWMRARSVAVVAWARQGIGVRCW